MTTSAKTVFYFGLYLYLVGTTLIFIPNVFLQLISIPETNEVWIRVTGLLTLIIGFYYHHMSATGYTAFFKLTIPARVTVFMAFVLFVILNMVPPILILVGAVDLAGATWTWYALKKEIG